MEAGTLTIGDLESPSPEKTAKLIKPEGSLDESNVDKLSKQIYDLIEAHPKNLYLLFDLEKLEYLNSKTIGYFTDWYGRINQGGGKLGIVNAPDNILDILNSVGLTELVANYSSMNEAATKLFE